MRLLWMIGLVYFLQIHQSYHYHPSSTYQTLSSMSEVSPPLHDQIQGVMTWWRSRYLLLRFVLPPEESTSQKHIETKEQSQHLSSFDHLNRVRSCPTIHEHKAELSSSLNKPYSLSMVTYNGWMQIQSPSCEEPSHLPSCFCDLFTMDRSFNLSLDRISNLGLWCQFKFLETQIYKNNFSYCLRNFSKLKLSIFVLDLIEHRPLH